MKSKQNRIFLDLAILQAREKSSLPDNWHPWKFEIKDSPYGDFLELTGAICPLYVRGPKKGKPNYEKADMATACTVQVGRQEYVEWVAKWEKETGKCAMCNGTGKEFSGWSASDGKTYKPCSRCEVQPEAQGNLLEGM